MGQPDFPMHINDLCTFCKTILYVDDTTIWEVYDTSSNDSSLPIASKQAEDRTEKTNKGHCHLLCQENVITTSHPDVWETHQAKLEY